MKKLIFLLAFTLILVVGQSQTASYDTNLDHSMTLTDARVMTNNFRDTYPSLNIGNTFNKDALQSIMNQTGCIFVKFYNAIDSDGLLKLVAVGVDINGTDMTNGLIMERSICCFKVKCAPCGGPLATD